MDKEEYILLYEKFIAGKCNMEEKQLLDKYSEKFLVDDAWQPQMGNENEVESRINARINSVVNRPKVFQFNYKWLAAASVILIALGGLTWFMLNPGNKPGRLVNQTHTTHDFMPGGNKAILTLANGIKVVLNNAKNGLISTQGNTQIIKVANGEIAYTKAGMDKAVALNTMSTPRGGIYELTLSDGTKVSLNAESSITYPTSFSGNSRRVTITGEAYFEVAKNAQMPFIVTANGTETKVLGTHFDIMAYKDEPNVKTMLFEGSVKFSKHHAAALLKPGQQALVNQGEDQITVQQANTEEALAWKNGYFIFQDEDIHSIMRKAARWYNVDVLYDDQVKNLSFGGSVSRYKNISGLLKVLQSTGTVHFKIEEGRVTVMK